MKKLLAILLAVVMTCTLVFSVSAADGDTSTAAGQNDSHEVKVTVNDETATVYNVDIQWTGLSFTYDYSKGDWQSDSHTYANESGAWVGAASDGKVTETINVINHSNAPVTVTGEYAANGSTGVTVEVTVANGSLPTAEGVALGNLSSLTATVTVTVSGEPTDKTANNAVVGNINITIG